MPSHRLAKITIDSMDIIGYSVAGEETVIGMPQLDVCFDIGKAPDQLIPISNLLLTHGHMDHAAGIGYYLSHRKFCGQSPGTIYAPENLLGPIKQIINAWGKLDGNFIPVKLIGVKPGDEYPLKGNLFVRVFSVNHSRGAVGYSIIEKRRKLKPEYLELTGTQIVELKKQGIQIDYTLEFPLVSYLGDTGYFDLTKVDDLAKTKTLITECTFFLDEHKDRADAGKHLHVDELAPMLEKMENEQIILIHLTQRMGIGQAKAILKKKLNSTTFNKTTFLMDRKWFSSNNQW